MTSNQIAFWKNREDARANMERERENFRSNTAKEKENYRSNLARETETHRANVANETETHRSNVAKEQLTRRGQNLDFASDMTGHAVKARGDNLKATTSIIGKIF